MKAKAWVYAALVATTMVWGGSFVAIKQALNYVSPAQLVVLRFLPASGVFAVLLLVRERQTLPGMLRSCWRSLALMGFFGVVVYHLALNTGERLIPAGTASLIIALNPAFVFVLSALFLRERISTTQWLGLCLAFAGLFVIVRFATGNAVDFRYLLGILITVAAPLAWAAYTVLSRPLSQRYSPLAVTGVANIMGTVPVLLIAQPAALARAALSLPPDGWASVLYLSLACTLIGFTVWNVALRHLEASHAGGFVYLSPLWGVVFSRLLLHEPTNWALPVGAAVVLGGVTLVTYAPRTVGAPDPLMDRVPILDRLLGLVCFLAYALQRGKLGPLRLLLVALLSGLLGTAYAAVRVWREGPHLPLVLLASACAFATVLLLWAHVQRYLIFRATASPPEPAPELRPEEKLFLRGSGFFEVNGMRRYLVEAPAVFWTTRLAEHIVCAKVQAPRFLGIGVPTAERAWWYAFLVPRRMTEIKPGLLCFGIQCRRAVRIVYVSDKAKNSLYLSCADQAQLAVLLRELQAKAGMLKD